MSWCYNAPDINGKDVKILVVHTGTQLCLVGKNINNEIKYCGVNDDSQLGNRRRYWVPVQAWLTDSTINLSECKSYTSNDKQYWSGKLSTISDVSMYATPKSVIGNVIIHTMKEHWRYITLASFVIAGLSVYGYLVYRDNKKQTSSNNALHVDKIL